MRKERKKPYIHIIIFILFCGAVFISIKAFSNSYPIENIETLESKKDKSILAFGDSLIQGVGATKDNDFISLISKEIGKPILNQGKSGDTTKSAISRIESAINTNPDIVIVLLGGNDYLRKIPQEETFANLKIIVDKFQANKSVVILLGVRGGLLKDNYHDKFAKFAKSEGVIFIPDVLDNILGDSKLMSDAIHPNDAGYEKIAEKVLPEVKKLIK